MEEIIYLTNQKKVCVVSPKALLEDIVFQEKRLNAITGKYYILSRSRTLYKDSLFFLNSLMDNNRSFKAGCEKSELIEKQKILFHSYLKVIYKAYDMLDHESLILSLRNL